MKESKAPFWIGQKVVALKSRNDKSILKDRIYTITGVRQVLCGCWVVSVAGVLADRPYSGCTDHGMYLTRFLNEGVKWSLHSLFAPYDPPRLEIPAELLNVDTKDGIDVIKEKELV